MPTLNLTPKEKEGLMRFLTEYRNEGDHGRSQISWFEVLASQIEHDDVQPTSIGQIILEYNLRLEPNRKLAGENFKGMMNRIRGERQV